MRNPELTEKIVEAYRRLGTKTAAARSLGIHRATVIRHLQEVGADAPIVDGSVSYREPNVKDLPEKGSVRRYILTSAQNNTKLFTKFWDNLLTYADFIDAEVMVSRFTYDKASYQSSRSTKPGTFKKNDLDGAWWDPELDSYICDDPDRHGSCQWQLAPGLIFCAEMNILPTAGKPLSGLESYTGRSSGIFPHAKIALESVASGKYEPSKFNFTTGTVTQRNYIQKKSGIKAEFHHSYAAVIVEVLPDGDWYVRQLHGDSRGRIYDVPDVNEDGAILVDGGEVTVGHPVLGINWGDVHASEIDPGVREINWGSNGIIDNLRPKYQFMHDLLSFRSRSHHEMKSFGKMYTKHVEGQESVEEETLVTAELMHTADRDFTHMIVVNSNHDRHGEVWLDTEDYRKDLLNAEFFLEAQLNRVRAMKKKKPWDFAKWALQRLKCPAARFLGQDESFIIAKKFGGGIECGMHGDEGPNGSKGTTRNLTRLGRKVNKGHDHTATIIDGVYSTGACSLNFSYMSGPTSHSVSHIVTYPNGKRTIVTCWNRKWRA